MEKVLIHTPIDVLPVLKPWANKRQENFIVITLNCANQVIKTHCVSVGIANRAIIHPRECFYEAIKDNAIGVILAHNHPSGEVIPSPEDKEITSRLCMAGNILGFPVVDHIIFAKSQDYYSFRADGLIKEEAFDCAVAEKYMAILARSIK